MGYFMLCPACGKVMIPRLHTTASTYWFCVFCGHQKIAPPSFTYSTTASSSKSFSNILKNDNSENDEK